MKILYTILLSVFSLCANNILDHYDAKNFKVELEFRSYDSTLITSNLNLSVSSTVINPQQVEYYKKHGQHSSSINTYSFLKQNVTTENGRVQLSFKNALDVSVEVKNRSNVYVNRKSLGSFSYKNKPGGKYTIFVHVITGGPFSMSSIYVFGKKVPLVWNLDSTGIGICFPESVTRPQVNQAIEFNLKEPTALAENKNLTLYMLPHKEGFKLISQHELFLCDVNTDNWTIFDTLPDVGSSNWKKKLIITPKSVKGEAFFFGWYLKSANRFGKGVLHVQPEDFNKTNNITFENYLSENIQHGKRSFDKFSGNSPIWFNDKKYKASELEKLDSFTPIPEWNYVPE